MSETNQNEISFSEDALEIIHLIQNTKENLFITGKAGTGKSTLLEYVSKLDPSTIVTAPTGIAAINVKGETIHSFFKLKPGYELDEAKHMRITDRMKTRFGKLHTVIIDEISMVRADIFDAIGVLLQRVRNNTMPFGGVRMILFGDLFQLPPVLQNDQKEEYLSQYKTPYFFSAQAFIQKDLFYAPFTLRLCELTTIYRQKDPNFTSILNKIRTNTIDKSSLATLNEQVKNTMPDDDYLIKLVSTNAIANKINAESLRAIEAPEVKFTANYSGNIDNLKPNEKEVLLKKGAQVMFLNNDSKKRWFNGTIGKVLDIGEAFDEESNETYKYVQVELEDGKKVKTSSFKWEISKYKFDKGSLVREEIGTFTQIPLKLAWAITIHKSQGKTFNKVKIDLGRGSFAHGQTYVALSRCRSLENIILAKPIRMSDIIVDEEVVEYLGTAEVS